MNTKYYNAKGSYIEDQTWKQMSNTAPIGLIYLHDYYYQAKQDSCQSDKNSNYTYCQTQGWMHMKNNGGATSGLEQYEWTMTRLGLYSSSSTSFGAWRVDPYSNVWHNGLYDTYAVRPVFYLKSDIELEGEGTTQSPFYIIK